jgi:hypothetical protein
MKNFSLIINGLAAPLTINTLASFSLSAPALPPYKDTKK